MGNTASLEVQMQVRFNHKFLEYLKSPKTAIEEGVVQICLFNLAVKHNKYSEFKTFLNDFDLKCRDSTDIYSCSRKLRTTSKPNFFVAESSISSCIADALQGRAILSKEDQYPNGLLAYNLEKSKYFDFQNTPSVFINDELIRGNVEGDVIANAICDSLLKRPLECKSLHKALSQKVRDELKFDPERIKPPSALIGLLMIVFITGTVFILVFYIGRCVAGVVFKKSMEDKIMFGLSEYKMATEGSGMI